MKPVAVLIPTLRRPESLARTLRSVLAQARAGALLAEIVVVDNSPEASAAATVAALSAGAAIPIRFLHEPHPGVATARNRGLAGMSTPQVAFIDDDEEAPPGWLGALYDTHQALDADVTFGPVRGLAPDSATAVRPYLERFFSRLGPAESGLTGELHGCGCSMMRRATALAGPAPFDVACDQIGGEDDRLFSRLEADGARFAWAAEAWVWEHAPSGRANLGYALRRAFGYGQSPSQLAFSHGDPLGVAKWMAVGSAQAALHAAAALALHALRRPGWPDQADRAARGLGKVFWFKAPRFYGAAALARSNPGGPARAASANSPGVSALPSS